MTFIPVVPAQGIAGWQFLQRTYDSQFKAFTKSPVLERDTKYFLENISKVKTAEQLVSDRRLLGVALGAFGLQDDINNRYFIQKILQDGTIDDKSLANKLADDRYKKLSEAFGFGPGEIRRTGISGFMSDIAEKNKVQSFEVSVGEQNDSMRIALYAQRELVDLSKQDVSDDAKWFSMMALPPLRSMFETALGLPASFGQIDIDQQKSVFQDRMRTITGDASFDQFSDPELREKLTNLYLARSQIANQNFNFSSQANALTLLQTG